MSTKPRSRRFGAALPAVALLASIVAGCGTDEPPEALDLPGSSGSGQPTDDESQTSAPPDDQEQTLPAGMPSPTRAPSEGQQVQVDDDSAAWPLQLPDDSARLAVAEVLVKYIDVRLEAYRTVTLELPLIAALAVNQPLSDVQSKVDQLRRDGHRTAGDAWLKIDDEAVTVKRSKATITGACMLNGTVDVDDKGIAQESPEPAYDLSATLKRFGNAWLVADISFDSPSRAC